MEMSAGLSLKLLATTRGYCDPWGSTMGSLGDVNPKGLPLCCFSPPLQMQLETLFTFLNYEKFCLFPDQTRKEGSFA